MYTKNTDPCKPKRAGHSKKYQLNMYVGVFIVVHVLISGVQPGLRGYVLPWPRAGGQTVSFVTPDDGLCNWPIYGLGAEWVCACEASNYSARSAFIGSMEAARRAGIRQAAMQEISTAVHIMPMLAIGLANIELFASLSDAHLEQSNGWLKTRS
jgi:hypothetical protein